MKLGKWAYYFVDPVIVALSATFTVLITQAVFPNTEWVIPIWAISGGMYLAFHLFFVRPPEKVEVNMETIAKNVFRGIICPVLALISLYDVWVVGIRQKALYEKTHTLYFIMWTIPGLLFYGFAGLWYGSGIFSEAVFLATLLFGCELWWLDDEPTIVGRNPKERPIIKGLIVGLGAPVFVLNYFLKGVLDKIK